MVVSGLGRIGEVVVKRRERQISEVVGERREILSMSFIPECVICTKKKYGSINFSYI